MKSWFAALVAAVALVTGLAVGPAHAFDEAYMHHVVFHVDDNDKAKMNITLNNAANVTQYYQDKNETVEVEVVTYGPGLHMLRADTSPVKARLDTFSLQYDNVRFAACANTMKGMTKKEGKEPELVQTDNIRIVPSGVVQLMIRQDQGWSYIRP